MRVMKIGGTNGLPSAAKTRFPKDGGEALEAVVAGWDAVTD
jgi:hypothetical protein